MISYKTQDGHCDNVNRKGIGEHCFGDFYYGFFFANSDNPYTTSYFNPYPPFALLLLKPFIYLNTLTPGKSISLILYLVINLMCAVIAVAILTRNIQPPTRILIFSVLFFSAPLIVAFDRGNNIVYLFLLLTLFLDSTSKGRSTSAILIGTIMTLLKPQMFLLCLVYLRRDTRKVFLKYFTTCLSAFFASFLLFPKSFPGNIKSWFEASNEYQDYGGTSIVPVNISLSNSVGILRTFVNYLFSGKMEIFSLSRTSNIILMCGLIFLVVSIFLLRRNISHNFVERSFLIVVLIILAPGTTFHYYYLLLIPFAKYFLDEFHNDNQRANFMKPNEVSSIKSLFQILLLLIIPCWAIPAKLIFVGSFDSAISLHWQVANFTMVLMFIYLLIGSRQSKVGSRHIVANVD